MCKVCDNIWEDYCSCKGITYNEEFDTFYSQCGDAYYDFPIEYCYECGRKLDKALVKEGGDPERGAKKCDCDDIWANLIINALEKSNCTGAKDFFNGTPIETREVLENLKFGKEMKVTITKEKNERRRME